MKKFYAIIGTISGIVGFIMTLSAQIAIWSNTRYTWTRPYTSFEVQTLLVKWIGLMLLISGIVDITLIVVSKIYTAKNVQDVNVQEYATIVCKHCGLRVNKETSVCPKCKNQIKIGGENVENNN